VSIAEKFVKVGGQCQGYSETKCTFAAEQTNERSLFANERSCSMTGYQ